MYVVSKRTNNLFSRLHKIPALLALESPQQLAQALADFVS